MDAAGLGAARGMDSFDLGCCTRRQEGARTCHLLWTGVPLQQGVTQAIEIPLPDASAPARFSTGSSWRLKDEPVTGRQGGRPVLEPHMCWGLGTGVRPGPRAAGGPAVSPGWS